MIVWQKQEGTRRYSVTRAGMSTRLYTNGVFHSQYNPRQPVAGNLWDLLFLPALMHPTPLELQRVLILGVGGGAVIQQLNHFLQPQHIVGVDLDNIHLQVARRFFHVAGANVELIQAEAKQWLRSYKGPKFDLIVEDLFVDAGTAVQPEPVRAIPASTAWLGLLQRYLNRQGVLVMNFESRRCLSQSDYRTLLTAKIETVRTRAATPAAKRSPAFAAGYVFSHTRYENAVAAFVRQPLKPGQFAQALQRFKALDRRRKSCRLNFHYRKLTS